jgi:hypothetical protein
LKRARSARRSKPSKEDKFPHAPTPPRPDPLRSALAKLDPKAAVARVWACGLATPRSGEAIGVLRCFMATSEPALLPDLAVGHHNLQRSY